MEENKVLIKTRFASIEECAENCVDQVGRVRFSSSLGRKIIGEVSSDYKFVISSSMKNAATHEFVGDIVAREDGIYMVGIVRPRKLTSIMTYISIVLGVFFGIGLILSFNPVFVLFGFFFIFIPWLNLLYLKKSQVLLGLIKNKVC